ncbi:neuronal acetylcholine receptor subunit alpha-9-like isoform X2 [Physella acuta]|uniref:neuronal acetylcholine receptor subunit alpha-9-like isoform X2 n=1 Tax=Physella acuta TaxID=109671 RepID=UPI0027DC6E8A|nr:neuronal acetylcholine receptor subunit alpha-9-like isoform X2 [Physella acuta]
MLILLAMILILLISPVYGKAGDDMARLYELLFLNHNKDVRPICDGNMPLEVKIQVILRQIVELNENKQELSLTLGIGFYWFNCFLQWDPVSYGNLTSLTVPFKRIWTPDISNFESIHGTLIDFSNHYVTIKHTGVCMLHFPMLMKSSCSIDVYFFPYDTQSCYLVFGSLSYYINTITLERLPELSQFIANSAWSLVSFLADNTTVRGFNREPYTIVSYHLVLKRRPYFYLINLIIPSLLFSLVATFGFLLPVESDNKINLQVSVFLSFSFFLLLVSRQVPPNSEHFPLLGLYFISLMVLVSLSIMMNILVLNVHHKSSEHSPVPLWLKGFVFRFLDKFAYLHDTDVPQRETNTSKIRIFDINEIREQIESEMYCYSQRWANASTWPKDLIENYLQVIHPVLEIVNVQLDVMEKSMRRKQLERIEKHQGCDWMRAAHVLDRLFLMLFVILVGTCTCCFLAMMVNN